MEAGKFGRSKAKEAKVEAAAASGQDKEVYSVVTHMERTLFIVDLTKLEAEGDTLVDALVVYRPMAEYKKASSLEFLVSLCVLTNKIS